MLPRFIYPLALAIVFLAVGCGGGGSSPSNGGTPTPTPTPASNVPRLVVSDPESIEATYDGGPSSSTAMGLSFDRLTREQFDSLRIFIGGQEYTDLRERQYTGGVLTGALRLKPIKPAALNANTDYPITATYAEGGTDKQVQFSGSHLFRWTSP
jgi:hypothetical protein